jgi:hypothetical protein
MEKGGPAASSNLNLEPESGNQSNDRIKSPPDSSREKT